jgi:hypothetical protein
MKYVQKENIGLSISRLPCQLILSQLVLRATRLCRLWPANRRYRRDLRSGLLESLRIFHPDLFAANSVFRLLLVFAITKAKGVVLRFADGTWIDSRERLPFALLADRCAVFCLIEVYFFRWATLECYFATIRGSWWFWSWLEEVWVRKWTG